MRKDGNHKRYEGRKEGRPQNAQETQNLDSYGLVFLVAIFPYVPLGFRPLINPGFDHVNRAIGQIRPSLGHTVTERRIRGELPDQVAPAPVSRNDRGTMLAPLQQLRHRPDKQAAAPAVATDTASLLKDGQNVGTEGQRILGCRRRRSGRLRGYSLVTATGKHEGKGTSKKDPLDVSHTLSAFVLLSPRRRPASAREKAGRVINQFTSTTSSFWKLAHRCPLPDDRNTPPKRARSRRT